ncbi:zf-CCHC domain-containing protein [Tanacetum coccineum]
MIGNRKLFSSYKAYNGGNVIFSSNLRSNIIGKGQICDNKCRVTFSEHDSEITKDGKVIGFSSKNYVRKFLRALHPKWRAKVTAIEESKDLASLALDELISNLKSSDDETSTSGSDDEEYAMAKGKSDRKCFRCGDPNHLISECPKLSRNKDQKAFIGGSWSDSENDAEDKTNDETCLMAQSSNEVTLNSSYYSDNATSLDNDSMLIEYDSLCEISLQIINKNKILKTKRDLLEKEILELNEKIKKLKRNKEIKIACKSCEELKLEIAKLKETQVKFVKFDKSTNSLREILNNQKSSSCKVGLGFDSGKALTSGTKTMSFVGSSTEKAMDGSTIKISVGFRPPLPPPPPAASTPPSSPPPRHTITHAILSTSSHHRHLRTPPSPSSHPPRSTIVIHNTQSLQPPSPSFASTTTAAILRSPPPHHLHPATTAASGGVTSTLPRSMSRTYGEKGTEHVFSPPMSSRSDFVITKKKLIHNSIDESKKPSLKPSLKSGIGMLENMLGTG